MFDFTALFGYKMLFMVELLLAEFLYAYKLKRRNRFILRCACMTLLSFGVTFAFPILFYNAIYSSLMFICLFGITVFAMIFCFDEPVLNILFCGIAAYTTRHLAFQCYSMLTEGGNILSDIFTGADTDNIFGNIYENVQISGNALSLETLFWLLIYIDIYIIIYAVVFALFGKRLWKIEDLKIRNTSFLALVAIVLLIDIFLNAVLVYITDDYNELYSIIMYVYNILCCLLTLYMQFSMIRFKKMQKELDIISYLWRQGREQYELAKENIDLINLKCHDMKHQIRQGLMLSMNNNSIKEIENLISIYDSTVKTGNEALDVILTEKSLICNKNGISLTCIADGEKLMFMDETDIYSLFGNLVDNAMEAVMKIDDPERRIIGLNIRSASDMLVVNVNNYYAGKLLMGKDGFPVTTKKDKDYHGYGMKSIRMIVEKYDGDITVTAKDGVFDVDIILLMTKKTNGGES